MSVAEIAMLRRTISAEVEPMEQLAACQVHAVLLVVQSHQLKLTNGPCIYNIILSYNIVIILTSNPHLCI